MNKKMQIAWMLSIFLLLFMVGDISHGIEIINTPKEEIQELVLSTRNPIQEEDYADLVPELREQGMEILDDLAKRTGEDFLAEKGYTYLMGFDKTYSAWVDAKDVLEETLTEEEITVQFIEPNYPVQATVEYNLHPSQEWHYDMIYLQEAWDITRGSTDVQIAVLDTGVNYLHPGLEDRVSVELGGNYVEDENEVLLDDPMDRNGHGTHVAGIIGSYGMTKGIMDGVSILPIKVLNDEGEGSNYWIYDGIMHAIEHNADVINISFGSTQYSQLMEMGVDLAEENNVIMVAASGNDGVYGLQYPAAYPSVISVGSVNPQGETSKFSNYDLNLDVVAPGEGIYSTGLEDYYQFSSGTSMAAPHVTGVVGLMRSLDTQIPVDEVRRILTETATKGAYYNEDLQGSGIVNSFEALKAAAPEEEAELEEKSIIDPLPPRIDGQNRYETAYEIAMGIYGDVGADTVILVRGDGPGESPNIVDGLTASALSGALDAPILLTPPDRMDDATLAGLVELETKNVILIGGEQAIHPAIEENLVTLGMETERIHVAGGNRYSTAAAVADRVYAEQEAAGTNGAEEGKTVIIVGGHALADSLLAGPVAAKKGYPIMLVSSEVRRETREVIENHGVENLIIVGGEAVVSLEVERELNALVAGEVQRIAGDERYGKNRFGTSMEVHESSRIESRYVTLVNGYSFVDAVAASALKFPILYIEKEDLREPPRMILQEKNEFIAIGGTAVISEEVVEEAVTIIENP